MNKYLKVTVQKALKLYNGYAPNKKDIEIINHYYTEDGDERITAMIGRWYYIIDINFLGGFTVTHTQRQEIDNTPIIVY